MDASAKDIYWVKKVKWLIQVLIVSVALNIGLLITFAYFVWKDRKAVTDFSSRGATIKEEFSVKNSDLLTFYSRLSYPELVTLLQNQELAEEGYTKRDLSLACLVAFHYFHIEKALGAPPIQIRKTKLQMGGLEKEISIFPALEEFQYQAIIKYAKTERWPLTSQGIFYEIQKTRAPRDPSLLEAFYLTPEFHSVLNLFCQSDFQIDKQLLVEMVAQYDWSSIYSFFEEQRVMQDFSLSKRRAFLLDYLKKNSKIAAILLVETDREFCAKKLDDVDAVALLDLISEKTIETEKFAKELLISTRSDKVWQAAAKKLYAFSGEHVADPYDHGLALQRFAPESIPAPQAPKEEIQKVVQGAPPQIILAAEKPSKKASNKKAAKKKIHVVEKGDSLWKIAKKYKVSIEAIKKVNHLESEKLRLGKELEIPQ